MGQSSDWAGEGKGIWNLSSKRFLSLHETRLLREYARKRAASGRWKRRSAVLEWVVLEIALESGLRVSEIASLTCGDIEFIEKGGCIYVRRGKGGKSRTVWFGKNLASVLKRYLHWKARKEEYLCRKAPLLLSKRTGQGMTARALQKMFARVAEAVGVRGHSFHHMRHTYATYLYRASGNNLRLVQKQLGHASIRTTEIYADILDEDAKQAVNQIYK